MQWVGRAAKLHRTACATKGVAKSSHLGFQNVMDTYSTSTQEKKLKSWAILASPLSGRVSITCLGVCRSVVVACAGAARSVVLACADISGGYIFRCQTARPTMAFRHRKSTRKGSIRDCRTLRNSIRCEAAWCRICYKRDG